MIIDPHTLIWIRGAGEIGSATAVILYKIGFRIVISDINPPLAIRRSVTFSDAILDGEAKVAGIQAKLRAVDQFSKQRTSGFIPLFIDDPNQILSLKPSIIIDARMIKFYDKDYRKWANHFIGFGPGFIAKENCHAVIETMRGHNLGKIIYDGLPIENTDIPGTIGGQSKQRVLYSPSHGKLEWHVHFGEILEKDQLMGTIASTVEIRSPFHGIVRGLIHPSVPMNPGLKIADVDPRGEGIDFTTLSDKSRSLGRAALEAVMLFIKNQS